MANQYVMVAANALQASNSIPVKFSALRALNK